MRRLGGLAGWHRRSQGVQWAPGRRKIFRRNLQGKFVSAPPGRARVNFRTFFAVRGRFGASISFRPFFGKKGRQIFKEKVQTPDKILATPGPAGSIAIVSLSRK